MLSPTAVQVTRVFTITVAVLLLVLSTVDSAFMVRLVCVSAAATVRRPVLELIEVPALMPVVVID